MTLQSRLPVALYVAEMLFLEHRSIRVVSWSACAVVASISMSGRLLGLRVYIDLRYVMRSLSLGTLNGSEVIKVTSTGSGEYSQTMAASSCMEP